MPSYKRFFFVLRDLSTGGRSGENPVLEFSGYRYSGKTTAFLMENGGFLLVVPKTTPGSAGGIKKALAESKGIKKNPSIEQKWFADHTSTIERDSN